MQQHLQSCINLVTWWWPRPWHSILGQAAQKNLTTEKFYETTSPSVGQQWLFHNAWKASKIQRVYKWLLAGCWTAKNKLDQHPQKERETAIKPPFRVAFPINQKMTLTLATTMMMVALINFHRSTWSSTVVSAQSNVDDDQLVWGRPIDQELKMSFERFPKAPSPAFQSRGKAG